MKSTKIIRLLPLAFVNFLFLAAQISGAMLAGDPALKWTASKLILLFAGAVAGAVSLTALMAFVWGKCSRRTEKPVSKAKPFLSFPLCWLILFAAYIPGFLIFYPGILAYDAFSQIGQSISLQFVDQHPVLHTLLIKLFWDLGKMIGNVTLGISLFVLLQMILLSLGLSFSVSLLWKNGLSGRGCTVLMVLFALFPYNVLISLSVAKAALFAAAFVPFCVLIWVIVTKGRNSLKWDRYDLLLFILTLPSVFFRSNARYAILAAAGIVLLASIFSKKGRMLFLRLFTVMSAGTLLSMVIMSFTLKAVNATQADRREMLSVPAQQIARTACYHEGEFTEEERWHLNEFILNEAWKEYRPSLADPVKRWVNTYHVKARLKSFIKVYLGLFAKYPGEYFNAGLTLDAGYLYLFDKSCLDVYGYGAGYGFVQTTWPNEIFDYGIEQASLFPGAYEAVERLLSDNTIQELPVAGFLFRPGYVMWAYLYLILAFLYAKRPAESLAPVLAFLYIGTLLLGPCVQMRYIYPVWALLPLCVAAFFTKKENRD